MKTTHNAICVKDLSYAEIKENSFKKNDTVFNLFVKKPIFGPSKAFLEDNYLTDNVITLVKDSESMIIE